jgi:hypothetical protein
VQSWLRLRAINSHPSYGAAQEYTTKLKFNLDTY